MKSLIAMVSLALLLGSCSKQPPLYEKPEADFQICHNKAVEEANREYPQGYQELEELWFEVLGMGIGTFLDMEWPSANNPNTNEEEGMRELRRLAKENNDREWSSVFNRTYDECMNA